MSSNHGNRPLPVPETQDNIEAQECKSTTSPPKNPKNWWLVLLYSTMTVTGILAFPLLQRVYFTHGGSSKWLSSLLQSVGIIIFVFPLSFLYFKSPPAKKIVFFMDLKLALSSASLGVIYGICTFLVSAGLSSIPVSTSALLGSTQLAFTALFAFIIVRQKITFYSLNSVVVVTSGVVVIAQHTSGDKPLGESRSKYLLGFFLTLLGASLQGLMYPLIEFAYGKSKKPVNYLMVLQFQFVMVLFGALFSIAGMLITKDYKIIVKEAKGFGLGEVKYYVILVVTIAVSQLSSLGGMGLISCTSSLFTGILVAATLPMTEVASVITFGDKFNGQKGLSLFLCLWGFSSYFFGEYRKNGKAEPMVELPPNSVNGVNDITNDTMPKQGFVRTEAAI